MLHNQLFLLFLSVPTMKAGCYYGLVYLFMTSQTDNTTDRKKGC